MADLHPQRPIPKILHPRVLRVFQWYDRQLDRLEDFIDRPAPVYPVSEYPPLTPWRFASLLALGGLLLIAVSLILPLPDTEAEGAPVTSVDIEPPELALKTLPVDLFIDPETSCHYLVTFEGHIAQRMDRGRHMGCRE